MATLAYKCFWDLSRMHSCAYSLVVNQAVFVLLAYTLVQAHLVLRQRQQLNHGVWERTWQLLAPTLEVMAVYYRQRFCLLTLAEFGRTRARPNRTPPPAFIPSSPDAALSGKRRTIPWTAPTHRRWQRRPATSLLQTQPGHI